VRSVVLVCELVGSLVRLRVVLMGSIDGISRGCEVCARSGSWLALVLDCCVV